VSCEYIDGKLKRIDTVVISNQHAPDIDMDTLKNDIKKYVIHPVLSDLIDANTIFHINPTGKFVI